MPPDVFGPLTEWEEEYERRMDRAADPDEEWEQRFRNHLHLLNLIFYFNHDEKKNERPGNPTR